MQWPPDFARENERRSIIRQVFESCEDPRALGVKLYADDPVAFICDWGVTFDPRNASRRDADGKKLPLKMPFVLFERQKELVLFLKACVDDEHSGLIEKARDMGATWVCCGFSVWLWLYGEGAAIGWGSRKEALIDRLGDPSTIFDKIRRTIDNLPEYILPVDFNAKDHLAFMKALNPETGAAITGEAGDNIGRGGRTTAYIVDESAHLERPELVEAALGDNTDVRIDISSVNGPNNVFYKKRHGGDVDVFIMDWRDHPGKTQEWYDARKQRSENEGLAHIFAQEVDRDYTAAMEGILIPGKWVKAAIDAHKKLGLEPEGEKRGGFDVADEGGDVNAFIGVHGVFITTADKWGEGDTYESTHRVDRLALAAGIRNVKYDSVGVGSGVKAAAKRLKSATVFTPYNGGGKLTNPNHDYVAGKKNKDMFANKKAQDWWSLRDRFRKTYEYVVKGRVSPVDELIVIDSTIEHRDTLVAELSQVTYGTNGAGQIVVNKNPKGTKSPNMADGAVEAFSPDPVGPRMRILR